MSMTLVAAIRDVLAKEKPRPEILAIRDKVLLVLLVLIAAFGLVPITLGALIAIEQGQTTYAVLYGSFYLIAVVGLVHQIVAVVIHVMADLDGTRIDRGDRVVAIPRTDAESVEILIGFIARWCGPQPVVAVVVQPVA